jgi:hypothetical protein
MHPSCSAWARRAVCARAHSPAEGLWAGVSWTLTGPWILVVTYCETGSLRPTASGRDCPSPYANGWQDTRAMANPTHRLL